MRADAGSKQQLGAIDVADSADDILIHQQLTDRSLAALNARDEPCLSLAFWVGVDRVWAKSCLNLFYRSPIDNFANSWPTKVSQKLVTIKPCPHLAIARHIAAVVFEAPLAIDAKVNSAGQSVIELKKKLLANCSGSNQSVAIDQVRFG